MANYSKNNFILKTGDNTSLRIRDIKNNIKYTVYFNNSTVFFNNANYIVIRTNGDVTDINLDFENKAEAIQALLLLNREYANIKNNYETKKKVEIIEEIGGTVSEEERDIIFSNEPDAQYPLLNNQTEFQLPNNTLSVTAVAINGVVINDFHYNITTKKVTIDPDYIGYELDTDDEVMITIH